jgi:hypothetical protein
MMVRTITMVVFVIVPVHDRLLMTTGHWHLTGIKTL